MVTATHLAQVNLKDQFLLAPGKPVATTYSTPAALISVILPQVYLFSGLILLVLLVVGGFRIITGAGDPKTIESGKKTVISAMVGFAVIFVSYWIIQIVQIVTGVQIFNSNL